MKTSMAVNGMVLLTNQKRKKQQGCSVAIPLVGADRFRLLLLFFKEAALKPLGARNLLQHNGSRVERWKDSPSQGGRIHLPHAIKGGRIHPPKVEGFTPKMWKDSPPLGDQRWKKTPPRHSLASLFFDSDIDIVGTFE
jgi:hypothetical protein